MCSHFEPGSVQYAHHALILNEHLFSMCSLANTFSSWTDTYSVCVLRSHPGFTHSACILCSHHRFTYSVCILCSYPGFAHSICALHSHLGPIPIQFVHCALILSSPIQFVLLELAQNFRDLLKNSCEKNLKYPYIPCPPSSKGMVYSLNFYISNGRINVELSLIKIIWVIYCWLVDMSPLLKKKN